MTVAELERLLGRLDGRGYKAYERIAGAYDLAIGALYVDHVQADPFAPPTRVRVRIPQRLARLPAELFSHRVRRIAFQDFLARCAAQAIRQEVQRARGTGKSGLLLVDAGGQEVLERTAVVVTEPWAELRLEVGLPAAGRMILGQQAAQLLCRQVPQIAAQSLLWERLPQAEARAFVACVENQESLREQLAAAGLVAFVADGSILPRASGVSQLPLAQREAIPFQSPASLRATFALPNPHPTPSGPSSAITGMGIPQGVTLIVGGGFHGKSTLLQALVRGVYPHIPGDGREYVVTIRDAVKIRAEDGRRVEHVDISPFIGALPYGRTTTAFCTENASGSTSQAANIVEALEIGARLLLLDEDTCATNFMVRDARMQALVRKEYEPITPFLDRVREIYEQLGVGRETTLTLQIPSSCCETTTCTMSLLPRKRWLSPIRDSGSRRRPLLLPRPRRASHSPRVWMLRAAGGQSRSA